MTSAKQRQRNKDHQRRVKFDYGGKKAFGAYASAKQARAFGVFAFAPSRGTKNGHRLF